MNQREKVLKGLECCRWSMQNVKPEKWKCDKCPYKDDDILNSYTVWQRCVNVLARDAYYLLNGDKLRQLPSAEPKWIPFKVRELTDEEKKEHPEWSCIVDCKLPEDGQGILVSISVNGHERVQFDEFYNDDEVYLDSGYEIGTEAVAWMPLPEPYKETEE